MVENISRRNNATRNVGTQSGDCAVFKISGDAILDGFNFLNSFLDRGKVCWKIDGRTILRLKI